MAGATRLRALRARAVPHIYLPLLVVVLAGVALRLYTMGVYSTIVTDYYTGDAGRYIRFAFDGLFEDPWQPAGYPALLAGIRAVTDSLTVAIAFQHALGIVTGLLLYATVRRAGAPRGVALVPAAVVLLSGDHLFIEHAILTESLWIAVLAGALYAAVRGAPARDLRWIAAAGVLLALSAVVRNVSLVLPVILALWIVVVTGGQWRTRVRAGAAALAPAVLVVAGYVVLATSVGSYSGLGEMSGWSLYSRVGQFADCRQFTPPDGTEGLCESRPRGERPGTFFYYFDPATPARAVFPAMAPEDGDQAGEFARKAILGQPVAYARTVVKDIVRFFDPQAGFDRVLSGSTLDDMSFRRVSPDPANTALYAARVETKYSDIDSTPNAGTGLLETYQRTFRLNGLLLFALLLLTAIGVLRGVGRTRAACSLFGACAVVLLVLPPVVSSYDGRYAVPPAALLAVSAALGVSALLARRGPSVGPDRDRTEDWDAPDEHPAQERAEPQTAGVAR